MDFSTLPGALKRRHHRRPVQLRARVRAGLHELDAVTENLSPGGAFLRVALPEGADRLVATLQLPDGKRITFQARVRWRRADPPGVGVQFHSVIAAMS
jgi:hypothetical protein